MKKLVMLALLVVVFAFTAGIDGCSDDTGLAILASTGAVEVGCEVGLSGDEAMDQALRDLHKYATTGEIPQSAIDELNTQLAKLAVTRPTLPVHMSNLALLLGGELDPNTGKLLGAIELSPRVIKAIATGYNSGFNQCKNK